ncbi:MAG: SPOR domain-containing protein [Bacteroidetes bacterium]|nr:SPOR domain-containing protein [Bacteroidota bacterium]
MKTTENHIVELLTNHECVVVPGFGGFVLNDKNARISIKNELMPPGKLITFNRDLNRNDGLLAEHIANRENLSYSTSQSRVENHVENWSSSLQKNKKLSLENIGFFDVTNEGKWRFQPDNNDSISPESFGLYPIQLSTESIAGIGHKGIEAFIKEKIRQRLSFLKSAGIGAVITVFILVGYWASTNDMAAGFFNFFSPSKVSTEIKIPSPQNNFVDDSVNKDEMKTKIADEVIIADQTGCYVIAGSFAKEENAKQLLEALKLKGFNPSILNKENNNYRVTFKAQPTDLTTAESLLEIVKTDNKDAWILKW